MNKIQKSKGALIGISIGGMVLGLALVVAGIILAIFGGKGLAGDNITGGILKLVFGILMIPLGGTLIVFGFIFTFTGASLKATNGSVAEGNLAKGTVNMNKCHICGHEISEGTDFCANCGHDLRAIKTCPNCGGQNSRDAKHCVNCGKEI